MEDVFDGGGQSRNRCEGFLLPVPSDERGHSCALHFNAHVAARMRREWGGLTLFVTLCCAEISLGRDSDHR